MAAVVRFHRHNYPAGPSDLRRRDILVLRVTVNGRSNELTKLSDKLTPLSILGGGNVSTPATEIAAVLPRNTCRRPDTTRRALLHPLREARIRLADPQTLYIFRKACLRSNAAATRTKGVTAILMRPCRKLFEN